MYEARNAEYFRIYESIVIELFLRLEIHQIGTIMLNDFIPKTSFFSRMVKSCKLSPTSSWLNPYIVPAWSA